MYSVRKRDDKMERNIRYSYCSLIYSITADSSASVSSLSENIYFFYTWNHKKGKGKGPARNPALYFNIY